MKTLLKPSFSILILSILLGCGDQSTPDVPAEPEPLPVKYSLKDSIAGERVNGPANISDTANGEVVFSLNDSTLVTSSEQQGDWYAIGLHMEIPNRELHTDTLQKGRKIMVDGKVVGEILKDMYVSTFTDGKKSWAELTGYIHKDHIHSQSIIENALTGYVTNVSDRSIEAFDPFIRSFQLEKDDRLEPFVTFFSYESWIDDPSPLVRVQLIFHDNRLVGVVHSRPLKLPNTTDYKLDRDFQVAFFTDTPKETIDDFTKAFNQFISAAD